RQRGMGSPVPASPWGLERAVRATLWRVPMPWPRGQVRSDLLRERTPEARTGTVWLGQLALERSPIAKSWVSTSSTSSGASITDGIAMLLVPNSPTVWGLPLAEHPVCRYSRSVEGGTVLTNLSIEPTVLVS